tara:strand:+ start:807 stop:1739 length:933 start_codon:yes stop_codon:yes gene_type:complete
MKPSKNDKTKYVGVEVECYGPLSRHELTRLLSANEFLTEITRVGTDKSIKPDEQDTQPVQVGIPEGTLNIEETPHPTRRLDLTEFIRRGNTWAVNRVIKYKNSTVHKRDDRLENPMYWCNKEEEMLPTVELHTYEVRLFTSQSKVKSNTTRLYKVLNDAGCKVNESCGLHVHLDMRYRNPMTGFANLVRCQGLLQTLQPEDRQDNEYCYENNTTDLISHIEEAMEDAGDGKYYSINPLSYTQLGTVEVRLAAGSMEADKVIAWIELLVNIVEHENEFDISYYSLGTYVADNTMEDSIVNTLEEMREREAA